ncbi:MAG: hypothetical protein ACKO25_07295 [Cyanobium sp.]
MTRMRSRQRRRHFARTAAFTQVELLIGSFLGALALVMALRVFLGHIRVVNRDLWVAQSQRSLSKLSFLLTSEVSEGCALSYSRRNSNLATFTYPQSPCTPPFRAATGSSTCNAGASNQFWILVPVLPESSELSGTTHTPSYRSIHYFLDPSDTTRLMRQGPRILASGRLDVSGPDNTDGAGDAPTLVLDGISSFTPLISNDCRSLTLTVELSVGEVFGATMERTSRFRTREKESIN